MSLFSMSQGFRISKQKAQPSPTVREGVDTPIAMISRSGHRGPLCELIFHGLWGSDLWNGGPGCDDFRVCSTDVVTKVCSTGESIVSASCHRFLLNKGSTRLSPTWHANCWCFVDQLVN
jgi:hypothetical protein